MCVPLAQFLGPAVHPGGRQKLPIVVATTNLPETQCLSRLSPEKQFLLEVSHVSSSFEPLQAIYLVDFLATFT